MRAIAVFLCVLLAIGIPSMSAAIDEERAGEILDRYLEASGGLDQLQEASGLSAKLQVEAYEMEYDLHLHSDGRFRIEGPDRITVFDGETYWQSFHGLVDKLPEDQLEEYERYSLSKLFFHDLLDENGQPIAMNYVGQETMGGELYELLSASTPYGTKTCYFNADTGLLEKIVELVPDPVFQERKNIYRFTDYIHVGDLRLYGSSEAVCVTDRSVIDPSSRFTDLRVSESFDENLFVKPASTVPMATIEDGTIIGDVISISERGSLITNITGGLIGQLGAEHRSVLLADLAGFPTKHTYLTHVETEGDIVPGDYIAVFNSSPALWMVKAYKGMTSDRKFEVGDKVRLTLE